MLNSPLSLLITPIFSSIKMVAKGIGSCLVESTITAEMVRWAFAENTVKQQIAKISLVNFMIIGLDAKSIFFKSSNAQLYHFIK